MNLIHWNKAITWQNVEQVKHFLNVVYTNITTYNKHRRRQRCKKHQCLSFFVIIIYNGLEKTMQCYESLPCWLGVNTTGRLCCVPLLPPAAPILTTTGNWASQKHNRPKDSFVSTNNEQQFLAITSFRTLMGWRTNILSQAGLCTPFDLKRTNKTVRTDSSVGWS